MNRILKNENKNFMRWFEATPQHVSTCSFKTFLCLIQHIRHEQNLSNLGVQYIFADLQLHDIGNILMSDTLPALAISQKRTDSLLTSTTNLVCI